MYICMLQKKKKIELQLKNFKFENYGLFMCLSCQIRIDIFLDWETPKKFGKIKKKEKKIKKRFPFTWNM